MTSLRVALVPFLVTRVLLFMWAWWAASQPHSEEYPWQLFPQWPWLDGWARWDSGWYSQTMKSGFSINGTAAFFPLYPFSSWVVGTPLRLFLNYIQASVVGGIALSYAGFLAGLTCLHRLMLLVGEPAAARRCLWLVCAFPFAYYFGAFYAEGLFFTLIVATFFFLETGQWWRACGFLSLAILTQPSGVLVGSGLALEMLWRCRREGQGYGRLLPLALPVLASLALLVFYSQQAGHPWATRQAQLALWGPHHVWNDLADLPKLRGSELAIQLGQLVCLGLGLVATVGVARRFGPGYAWAVAAALLAPAYHSLASTGRYLSVLFPCFMWFSEKVPRLWVILVVLGMLGQAYFLRLFVTWSGSR